MHCRAFGIVYNYGTMKCHKYISFTFWLLYFGLIEPLNISNIYFKTVELIPIF